MSHTDDPDYVYGDEATTTSTPVERQVQQMQSQLRDLQRAVDRCEPSIEVPDYP